MEPFQTLGNFSIGNRKYMSAKSNPLRDILSINHNMMSYNDGWSYRTPAYNAQMAASDHRELTKNWHQDGGRKNGVILWSNEYPTEVRMVGGRKILVGEPGDVILIDNNAVKHRIPKDFIAAVRSGEPTNRHFIRCILLTHPSDEQISKWKEKLKGKG